MHRACALSMKTRGEREIDPQNTDISRKCKWNANRMHHIRSMVAKGVELQSPGTSSFGRHMVGIPGLPGLPRTPITKPSQTKIQ